MRTRYGTMLAILAAWGSVARAEVPLLEVASADYQTSLSTYVAPSMGRFANHYAKRVALFRDENSKLDPAKKNVVLVGDSITEATKLPQFLPDGLSILNRGIGADGISNFPNGPKSRGLLHRIGASILNTNPSHVVLLIGINDMSQRGIPLRYWFEEYKKVIDQTRRAHPEAVIIVHTLPMTRPPYSRVELFNGQARTFNQLLREYAAEQKFPLVDLEKLLTGEDGLLKQEHTGDGLHLTPEAYRVWAEDLKGKL